MNQAARAPGVARLRVRVRGRVQGVGFRPFAWRLARDLGLAGWVRNDGDGVALEIEGDEAALRGFLDRLPAELPPPGLVRALDSEAIDPVPGEEGFTIRPSAAGAGSAEITPDLATCPECLAELFDPRNRRWRYPFINCTHCGPRYTITRRVPYDRSNTSMAGFTLCAECRREYESPGDRRFHAQPNACPACGPRLQRLDAEGRPIDDGRDAVAATLADLVAGRIVALKGLGGFHLACDARNAQAVARLRERKRREEKPFAVMVANVASARAFADLGAAEAALLESPERPIVLLHKRAGCDAALPGVAPGVAWLGAMLPYTPLHGLLFHEAAGRPEGMAWLQEAQPLALVMTSANPGGEPLVTGNDEAVRRLGGIADGSLVHDRPILVRADDSVRRLAPDGPAFIRRGRGSTPQPIALAEDGPATLALGGWFKNTVCVTRGREAFVSAHVGDLDNAPTCEYLERTVEHLLALLDVEPERIACDLHPDFFSTRLAARIAAERGLPLVQVQHHHAHAGAVAAEHGWDGPFLALALDGVGLGSDGAPWGGELLRVAGAAFERIGHLEPLALPGGDRAAREPWRMAAAALARLGRHDEIARRFGQPQAPAVAEWLRAGSRLTTTSSAGRLFDAAAGLLGVRAVMAFEGQAAMLLEGAAEAHGEAPPLGAGWELTGEGVLSLMPALAALTDMPPGERMPEAAAVFHATLVAALADWVVRAARAGGLRRIAFGGGCFLNHVLSRGLRRALEAAGLEVGEARAVPPNDGGLSLGQAWVARRSPVAAAGRM